MTTTYYDTRPNRKKAQNAIFDNGSQYRIGFTRRGGNLKQYCDPTTLDVARSILKDLIKEQEATEIHCRLCKTDVLPVAQGRGVYICPICKGDLKPLIYYWIEPVKKPRLNIIKAAETIFEEITKDVIDGILPNTISTYSDLHNYLDANNYLLLIFPLYCHSKDTRNANKIIRIINNWISEGKLLDVK